MQHDLVIGGEKSKKSRKREQKKEGAPIQSLFHSPALLICSERSLCIEDQGDGL